MQRCTWLTGHLANNTLMLSIADTVLSTKHHAINASVFASSLGIEGDLQFRNVCLFLMLVLTLIFAVGLEVSACLSSIERFLVAMGDTNPCILS